MKKVLFALCVVGAVACNNKPEEKPAAPKPAPASKPAEAPSAAAPSAPASAAPGSEGAAPGSAAPGSEGAAPGSAAPGSEGAAAPGGLKKIEQLGLQADIPADTTIEKAPVGNGVMISGGGFAAQIEPASDMEPKTLEAAKDDIKMYNPKNVQGEKLPDGYAITFENEGGMGANYWVKVRREIGGKAYMCSATLAQKDRQADVLKTCKSLTK
jgi:hypothetical protein